MGRDLVAKTLADLRGAALGWGLGLAAYGALVTSAFPSIRDNEAMEAYVESLPEAMLAFFGGADLTTAAGFYQAELFSYLPALLAVFTVGKAIQLTIGEEREGTMDLVLAQPVPRWQVLVGRFGGLALATFFVATGLALTLTVGGAIVGLQAREVLGLALWCYLAILPALAFGAAALAVAGFTHTSRGPLVAGAGLAAGSFLVDGLARIIDGLGAYSEANPYHWYMLNDPVTGTFSLWGLAGLLALTLGLVAVGALGYQRKDIGV